MKIARKSFIINRMGIVLLLFFACFFYFVNTSKASFYDYETFTSLTTGDICSQSDWSCYSATGTDATVQETTYWSFPKALKVSTDTYYSTDTVDFNVIDNQDIWSMYVYVPTTGSETATILLTDYTDDIAAQINFSYDNNIYNYGSDTGLNFSFDTWFKIDIEVSSTTPQSRIRIDNGAWSNWRTIGASVNTTDIVKFSTSDINYYFYVDNITYEGFFEEIPDVQIYEVNEFVNEVLINQEMVFYPSINYCNVSAENEICQFNIRSGEQHVGYTAYLFEDGSNLTDLSNSISSSTLFSNLYDTTLFVPNEDEVQKSLYDVVVLDDSDSLFRVYNDLVVRWTSSSTYQSICELAGYEDYDISTACEEIASSTGSFSDDFRFGVECGMNKAIYWSFKPRCWALNDMVNSQKELMNEFPLNLFNQVLTVLSGRNSTSSDFSFSVYVGELGTASDTIEIMTTQKIYDIFGDNYSNFYLFLQYLIYGVTALYFINYFI